MKKACAVGLVMVLVLACVAPAYCDGPLKKLGRGISNAITCPLEFPHRIMKVNKSAGLMDAMTYGVLQGICMVCGRLVAGAWEIATFPLPIPPGYQPLIEDPEFFWKAEPDTTAPQTGEAS